MAEELDLSAIIQEDGGEVIEETIDGSERREEESRQLDEAPSVDSNEVDIEAALKRLGFDPSTVQTPPQSNPEIGEIRDQLQGLQDLLHQAMQREDPGEEPGEVDPVDKITGMIDQLGARLDQLEGPLSNKREEEQISEAYNRGLELGTSQLRQEIGSSPEVGQIINRAAEAATESEFQSLLSQGYSESQARAYAGQSVSNYVRATIAMAANAGVSPGVVLLQMAQQVLPKSASTGKPVKKEQSGGGRAPRKSSPPLKFRPASTSNSSDDIDENTLKEKWENGGLGGLIAAMEK